MYKPDTAEYVCSQCGLVIGIELYSQHSVRDELYKPNGESRREVMIEKHELKKWVKKEHRDRIHETLVAELSQRLSSDALNVLAPLISRLVREVVEEAERERFEIEGREVQIGTVLAESILLAMGAISKHVVSTKPWQFREVKSVAYRVLNDSRSTVLKAWLISHADKSHPLADLLGVSDILERLPPNLTLTQYKLLLSAFPPTHHMFQFSLAGIWRWPFKQPLSAVQYLAYMYEDPSDLAPLKYGDKHSIPVVVKVPSCLLRTLKPVRLPSGPAEDYLAKMYGALSPSTALLRMMLYDGILRLKPYKVKCDGSKEEVEIPINSTLYEMLRRAELVNPDKLGAFLTSGAYRLRVLGVLTFTCPCCAVATRRKYLKHLVQANFARSHVHSKS